jgi:hypothetical protein
LEHYKDSSQYRDLDLLPGEIALEKRLFDSTPSKISDEFSMRDSFFSNKINFLLSFIKKDRRHSRNVLSDTKVPIPYLL